MSYFLLRPKVWEWDFGFSPLPKKKEDVYRVLPWIRHP